MKTILKIFVASIVFPLVLFTNNAIALTDDAKLIAEVWQREFPYIPIGCTDGQYNIQCSTKWGFATHEGRQLDIRAALESQRQITVKLKEIASADFILWAYTSDNVLIGYVSYDHWAYRNGGTAICIKQTIDLSQY